MSIYCQKCGQILRDDAKFCNRCGSSVSQEVSSPITQTEFVQTAGVSSKAVMKGKMVHGDLTAKFAPEDIKKNKVMAVLSYFGPLVLITILAARKSRYARFHANQALDIAFGWMTLWGYVCSVSSLLRTFSQGLSNFVFGILYLAYPVVGILVIMGIVRAASGKAKELPIWGKKRILKPVKNIK